MKISGHELFFIGTMVLKVKYVPRAKGNQKQRTKGNEDKSYQIEGINKEREIIKRNQMEILELKNTRAEMQNWLEEFKSTFNQREERISKLKNRTIEIIQSEDQEKDPEKKDDRKWTEPKRYVGHH